MTYIKTQSPVPKALQFIQVPELDFYDFVDLPCAQDETSEHVVFGTEELIHEIRDMEADAEYGVLNTYDTNLLAKMKVLLKEANQTDGTAPLEIAVHWRS